MAVTGSFRQQCPSCDANILIKDPKQIGKKVDCPNCKFRFVVAEPAAAKTDGEEKENAEAPAEENAKARPKGSQAVTAKKPAPPAAPGVKKKAGPRKPADDEDEDEAFDAKKKGSNNVLILGIGLSVVCLAILGVGGYFLFFSVSDASNPTKLRGGPAPVQTTNTGKKDTTPTGSGIADITNLLPPESQGVLSLNFKELVNGTVGRAAFDAPGGFRQKYFEDKFGLALKDIERVILAQNFRRDWFFLVARTAEPIKTDEFQKGLHLQPPPDGKFKGQSVFVTEPTDWLGRLGQLMSWDPKAAERKIEPQTYAVHIVDPQTFIVTDMAVLKTFLDAKGQYPRQAGAGGKPPSSKTFLTVNPELKNLLDQLESKPVLFSWACEVTPAQQGIGQALNALLARSPITVDKKVLEGLDQVATLGLAVQLRDSIVLTATLDGKAASFGTELAKSVKPTVEGLAKSGTLARRGFSLLVNNQDLTNPPYREPLQPKQKPPFVPKYVVKTRAHDKEFSVTLEPTLSEQSNSVALMRALQPILVELRGRVDMTAPQQRIHELAAALMALVEKEQKFPRGAFDRPIPPERKGAPFPPDERVSWLVELLPYLDFDDVRRRIKTERSWRDPQNNLPMAGVLIAQFLDRDSPEGAWWVRMPSLPGQPVARTQFVGVAGVGLDAAEYSASDPAVAKKLGIFGYERQTKLDDIKDGRKSTIAVLQVPLDYKRPWIAGGGATVQAVPESKSIEPFVCTQYDVKGDGNKVWGTFAIMADGAVRFIPATISDDAFKALCTINGGDKVDVDKETFLVPPPGKVELKAKDP
jgi:hypothetical protein